MSNSDKIADLEKQVADHLILAMQEKGVGWKKAWATPRPAQNAVTGHVYQGGNILMTGIAMMVRNITDPRFITFKQALAQGGKIRKGAKGIAITYFASRPRAGEDSLPEATSEGPRRFGFARISYVFPIADVEDLTFPPLPELTIEPHAQIDSVEAFVQACGVPVRGGQAAFYAPDPDKIYMPPLGLFRTSPGVSAAQHYYGTLLHELVHATGHKSRLDRDAITGVIIAGSPTYAQEELVAEIGSVMLGHQHQLQIEPREDNVAYVKGWIRLLQDKPRAILTAASAAAQAVRWCEAKQPSLAKVVEAAE